MQVKRAAIAIAILLAPAIAGAQTEKARAKEAYDRGVVAHKRGDFAAAAKAFAEADAIAPSDVALQAGLDAAVDADDPVIGSELIERSARGPISGTLKPSVEAAKQKLGGRAGRVRVECPASSHCTATIDGATLDTKKPAWSRVGPHTVVVSVDGEPQSRSVDVKPDQIAVVVGTPKSAEPATVTPHAPAAPAAPAEQAPAGEAPIAPRPARDKLPPIVFFAGIGATVVAGAAATFFMLKTKSKHDEFVALGCESAGLAGCGVLKNDGESSQTVANVAIGATALFAVATVVIGAVFTDWEGKPTRAGWAGAHVGPLPGGGLAGGTLVRF
ncbi:MAG: hypothetical protein KF819_30050 [Labilithrix sp.]|nr:hypothetical protein [Labilithrix sp.]